jgi:hypothetical protein
MTLIDMRFRVQWSAVLSTEVDPGVDVGPVITCQISRSDNSENHNGSELFVVLPKFFQANSLVVT